MGIPVNPTLFIGIGGQGSLLVNKIKNQVIKDYVPVKNNQPFPLVKFLAIDSEFDNLKLRPDFSLSVAEMLHLKFNPKDILDYLHNPKNLEGDGSVFIDSDSVKKVGVTPSKKGCGGWGLICKTAGIVELDSLYFELKENIQKLTNHTQLKEDLVKSGYSFQYELPNDPLYQIFIFSSLGGGTGRGLYELITFLLRVIFDELSIRNVRIRLINIMPKTFFTTEELKNSVPNYAFENTYTAFREIDWFNKNRYRPDNCLRVRTQKLLGGRNLKDTYEFLDDVVLISNILANGEKQYTSSYEEFTTKISKFFADYVFLGLVNSFIAYLENNASSIGIPKLREIKTNKERTGKYSRVAYYKVIFPTKRIAEYVAYYSIASLLKDLWSGFIRLKYDDSQKREKLLKQYREELEKLKVSSEFSLWKDPLSGLRDVDDNWTDRFMRIYYPIFNGIKRDFENISSIKNIVKDVKDKITDLSTEVLKYDGLSRVEENLKYLKDLLIGDIKDEIKEFFGEEHIKTKDTEYEEILNKIKEDFQIRLFETQNFLDEKRNLLDSILNEERERFNVPIIGQVVKIISPEVSPETREKIGNLFNETNQKLKDLADTLDKFKNLLLKVEFLKSINELISQINKNASSLREKAAYYERLAEKTSYQTWKEGEELLLNSPESGRKIFEELNYMLGNFIRDYDEKISKQNIRMLLEGSFDDWWEKCKSALNVYENEIRSKIYKFFEEVQDPLTFYFDFITRDVEEEKGEKERKIASEVDGWLKGGEFLSPIDTSLSGDALEEERFTYFSVVLPQSFYKDGGRYLEIVRNTKLSKWGFNIKKNANSKIRNEIFILGVQSYLPLFLFSEVYECKNKYLNIKSDEEKICRHNSKQYFSFEEPVGEDVSIRSEEDFFYLINLAYQLGALKANPESYTESIKIFKGMGYRDFIPTNSPDGTPAYGAELGNFGQFISNYPGFAREIADSIVDRYLYLLRVAFRNENKNNEYEILRKFLDPKQIYEVEDRVIPLSREIVNLLLSKIRSSNIREGEKRVIKAFIDTHYLISNYSSFDDVKKQVPQELLYNEQKLREHNFLSLDSFSKEKLKLESEEDEKVFFFVFKKGSSLYIRKFDGSILEKFKIKIEGEKDKEKKEELINTLEKLLKDKYGNDVRIYQGPADVDKDEMFRKAKTLREFLCPEKEADTHNEDEDIMEEIKKQFDL